MLSEMSFSYLASVVWEKLEFGFDVVLPIVAVWIFVKWVRESRRKSINDTLKSALLSYLLSMIQDLSRRFVKDVVEGCQKYEKVVDEFIKEGELDSEDGFDWDAMTTSMSDEKIQSLLQDAEAARIILDDFYNVASSYRYSVFPLLRAVGAGRYIADFDSELSQIQDVHNEIVGSIAMIEHKIEQGEKADAVQFIAQLSVEFQQARIESKEVCSFLSALIEQVVANSSGDSFESLMTEYKEKVFKTKELIR